MSADLQARLYRALFRIRTVEEEIARIYPTDKIKSPVHLSIGQEPVSVGVCEALEGGDVAFGTYRSHALYLAKGGDLKAMVAELYGKATGCAGGKGGSMHLIDASAGVMGASAVVGTTIPHAVGYAWGLRRRGGGGIVASFFGDGAVEEGVFSESLNFAALRRLPVLFVCENNLYAIHSPLDTRQDRAGICERARAHGIPAERVEDGDVMTIYRRAQALVREVREEGAGPRFLECLTYRWREHVGPAEDYAAGYRSRDEAAPWMERDSVRRLAAVIPADARARIEREVLDEIRDAFAYAEASPFPAADELYTDVFKEPWDGSLADLR